ncbi:MAG: hypothetical protein OEZ43_06105 [Gammaproteobacteria bacterium]|nr:hypothetical protein [Gammaproteobacteria bacterium]
MILTEPIEVKLYMLLGLAELIFILIALAIFLYLKVRKYKPHYQANTSPIDYIKRYLNIALDYSRSYANSLADDANKGDIEATKRRMHMVARLNWLVLEKDFISFVNPNTSYWDDINFRIKKMLRRWQELGFIEAPPNEHVITVTLSQGQDGNGEPEYDPSKGDISQIGPTGDTPADLRARVQYLEKQVRQMASYKTLYFGLQNTYEGIQKSYKELKKAMAGMRMDSVDAERLKQIIAEHEMAEKSMEDQLEHMEQSKKRLNEELNQLEAAYEALEHERAESPIDEDTDFNLESPRTATPAVEMIVNYSDLFDNYENVLREFRGFLHTLQVDTDTKLEIDEHAEILDRSKNEIKTCVSTLEMERDRLMQELIELKGEDGGPDSTGDHTQHNAA